MWRQGGLLVVPENLPTILHSANHSASDVIHTALALNSQAFGFHTPYRDLKDIAEDFCCNDPGLIDKAKAVVMALNKAASEKKAPAEEEKRETEAVQ